MAQSVTLRVVSISNDIADNNTFSISVTDGTVFPTTCTKAELIAGLPISLTSNTVNTVKVVSNSGPCSGIAEANPTWTIITPTPTVTTTPTPTITPTVTPTVTPTITPTPTVTTTPTPTVTPTDGEVTPTPTPTTTVCRSMDSTAYSLGYSASDSTVACDRTTLVNVYTTGNLPFTGVILYTDTTGCTTVNPGFYSDGGGTYFTVDQFGEITAVTNCAGPTPPPPTVYEVGDRTDTGAPFSVSACSDTCDTPLLTSVDNFNNVGVGTVIYADTGGTLFAGGNTWYGITSTSGTPSKAIQINNSGVVTNDAICETITPTPTPTVTPTYYRFENCDTGELVFQASVAPGLQVNDRYSNGVTNFIYDGTTTTLPGTIVTNLTYVGTSGCLDPTPTPTVTEYYYWIERCDAQIDRVMRTTTNSGLFAGSSPNDSATVSIFGTCYWIKGTATSGEFLTGGDEASYDAGAISSSGVGCNQCQGIAPTPTPTITTTPTPTVTSNSFSVTYDATSPDIACNLGTSMTVYSNCSTITPPGQGQCRLYTDPGLTSQAPGGYYADTISGDYYYVEIGGLVEEILPCTVATPTFTPTPTVVCNSTAGVITSLTGPEGACDGTPRTVYHNGPTGLSDATTVYTTAGCGTVQSNTVWYNDQGNFYQISGGFLTAIPDPNCP